MHPTSAMSAAALLDLLALFENAGFTVWLDGGWGVDALLGRQHRAHQDVDIVLTVAQAARLPALLAGRGFKLHTGEPPHSFVLADGAGLEVDVHAVAFDDAGNGVYRMQNGEDWIYPAEGFHGRGVIEGVEVKCLSATTQVLCHAHGYTPVAKDFDDMEHLARHFGLILPPQLRRPPA